MKYIHYGAKAFDPARCKPIKNQRWIKPIGGFWASPVNAETGWLQWCINEQFIDYEKDNFFTFKLSDFARVLHLRCVEDVHNLPKDSSAYTMRLVAPDFEALVRQGYDAMEIHISECPSLYSAMYGWDVDSILIMNPDIVVTEVSQ